MQLGSARVTAGSHGTIAGPSKRVVRCRGIDSIAASVIGFHALSEGQLKERPVSPA